MSFPEIAQVVQGDIYRQNNQPHVDGIKQVLDTLKDRVQPLTPVQMQIISYLEHLQDRPLHNGKKIYADLIGRIVNDRDKVAPAGFFIRVIESLIPRPTYIDGKSAQKMARENKGDE